MGLSPPAKEDPSATHAMGKSINGSEVNDARLPSRFVVIVMDALPATGAPVIHSVRALMFRLAREMT